MSVCFYCEADVSGVCPDCRLIGYCDNHAAFHRIHPANASRATCLPVRVERRPGIGRCIVALRPINPGELILQDHSVVFGPKADLSHPVCLECLERVSENELCLGCGLPKCTACQEAGRSSQHGKRECDFLNRKTIGRRDQLFWTDEKQKQLLQILTPLRLFIRQKLNPLIRGQLQLLMDHAEDRTQMETEEMQEYLKTFEELNEVMQSSDFYPDAEENEKKEVLEFQRMIGLLRTNAIGVKNGRQLFPLFAFLSHSCVNNAKHSLSPDLLSISVHSQRSIERGQEVTITYTNLLRGTQDRQARLQHFWHFRCTCLRCLDPTELGSEICTLKCPKCETGLLRQTANREWVCSHCSSVIAADTAQELTDVLDQLLQEAGSSPEQLEAFLRTAANVLHEHHYLCLVARRYLCQIYGQGMTDAITVIASNYSPHTVEHSQIKELYEMKQHHALKVLSVFNILDPGLSQSRGLTLLEVAIADIFLRQKSAVEIRQLLKEAFDCLDSEHSYSLAGSKKLLATTLNQLLS